jgi:predicted DCC family thiol-disulfide oxidoreductase YuxK
MKAGSNRSEAAAEAGSAVIVFDGVRAVQPLGALPAAFRPQGALPLRGDAGQQGSALLRAHGLDPQDPMSFLLLDAQGAWTDTDAILRVLAGWAAPGA